MQGFQKRYGFGNGDSVLATYGSDRTDLAFIDPAKNGKTRNTTKLCKKYGNNWGLKGSTFKVKRGELAVLVGPNGVGKTATVRILTTFTKPTDGKAEVLGMDVTRDYKNIRKKIAYLPQGFEVNNNLTPTESVKWSLVAKGCSLSDAKTRSNKWMQMMGIEKGWPDLNRSS